MIMWLENGHEFGLITNGLCRNPTLKECEDDTHILKIWTWESSETSKYLELNCKG
jgi:hypothetical protein